MLTTPPSHLADYPLQPAEGVRPFVAGDAEAVARLLTHAFKHTDEAPPQGMVDYLREAYLDAPWFDPEIAPRVVTVADGQIAGFVGVTAMPMLVDGRRIRTAILSSFAVDMRIADPTSGPRLLRDIRSGPQAAVLNDRSNAISVALMRSLSGETMPNYSLDWLRAIRPAGLAVDTIAARLGPARLLAPLAAPFDNAALKHALRTDGPHWTSPSHSRAADALADRDISAEELPDLFQGFLDQFPLRPDWTRAELATMLAHGARKSAIGDFHARLVSTKSGNPLGLFLVHGRKGRTAQVLQFLAAKGRDGAVIDRAIMFAADLGAVAIRGRVQPAQFEPLMERRALFLPAASSVLYSRDADVLQHFHQGTAFFTGLAGENWMRLNGDSFQ